jgi:hypothetical protein
MALNKATENGVLYRPHGLKEAGLDRGPRDLSFTIGPPLPEGVWRHNLYLICLVHRDVHPPYAVAKVYELNCERLGSVCQGAPECVPAEDQRVGRSELSKTIMVRREMTFRSRSC